MKGRIFLFLFALPFAGVGAWMGYAIGTSVSDAWEMMSWTPVSATLIRAGYDTHPGDDADTYEAFAEYAYTWAGRRYTGNRVSLSGGADNIGDYQRDMGERLRGAMARGESVTVRVDPDDPQSSILDPAIRWGLVGFQSIFFFIFGGAGIGMIVWAVKSPKTRAGDPSSLADTPWLLNDAWQTPEIRSDSRAAMWGAWVFATFWNLISAPLPFLIVDEVLEKDNRFALVGLLFPLVGLGLLWWAFSRTMEWRRFGAAPVTLDPFPGSIGGHVGGTIDLRTPFDADARYSVSLACLRRYESGSGKNRSRKEKAEWQDTLPAHAAPGPGGTRLRFRFDVPAGLAPSDADQWEDTRHLWRLSLNAALPGADLDRSYEIPVYPTARRSEHIDSHDVERGKSAQRATDLERIRAGIRIEDGVSGKSIVYPMGRNWPGGLAGMLIGMVFGGAGGFLAVTENHWLVGGVFLLVGSLIAVSGFYFLFNSLEVVRTAGTIRTVRRVLGVPLVRREMNVSDFRRFSTKSYLQTQSGSRHVMFYRLAAVRPDGGEVVVGEGFRGAGEAEAAAGFLARALGLTARPGSGKGTDGGSFQNLLTAD